ncbi:thrombomodulin-like isoform X1 [Penaeus monodon]|uniref:thrombomodulin-like isoform X1 n=1 Tax=Penaeus monodon TaxID=6687 RepID=UPI0018A76A0B|nr:thrombomodulin-like isoform X1 [Penaeus monodon]
MQLTILKTVFVIIFFAHPTEPAIGQKCSMNDSCSRLSEECVEGTCICKENAVLMLDQYSLAPKCLLSSSKPCEIDNCPENSICSEDRTCKCDYGYLIVDGKCKKGKFQEILEPCFVENREIFSCDFHKRSLCKSGKCVCFDAFFLDKASGTCKPQAEFLKANNLTEYRVMPGSYCRNNSDCIEGLSCVDFECACPGSCKYKEEKALCDCGAVRIPYDTITLGIILGLLIIEFWRQMIKRTINRHKASVMRAALAQRNTTTDHMELNPLQT